MLRSLRKLRPLIPLSAEYVVRNVAYRVLPVQHRSRYDNIFHCCVWKTASQWVRLILSDPRIYIYCDLKPQIGGDLEKLKPRARTIVTPVYCSYVQFRRLDLPGSYKAFFVTRDPRDILVSWYYSNRYSHPRFAGRDEMRAQMKSLSDEEALLWTLDRFGHFIEILRSWIDQAGRDPNVLLVRYEDLIGPGKAGAWAELLEALDIAVPAPVLGAILDSYSFRRMSGGREQGQEDRLDKYRKGQPGDWRNYFTAAVAERFAGAAGDVVSRLGYD